MEPKPQYTTSNSTPDVPNCFVTERMFERIDEHDRRKAGVLRVCLHVSGMYPTRDVQGEYEQANVNRRAALHEMIDQLDDTELWAAYESIRLLAYTERPSDFLNA